jgi:hypothetical protein
MNAPAIRLNLLPSSRPALALVQKSCATELEPDGAIVAVNYVTKVSSDDIFSKHVKATMRQCRVELWRAACKLPRKPGRGRLMIGKMSLSYIDYWISYTRRLYQSDFAKTAKLTPFAITARQLESEKSNEQWEAFNAPRFKRLWTDRQIAMLLLLAGHPVPPGGRITEATPQKSIDAVRHAVSATLKRHPAFARRIVPK